MNITTRKHPRTMEEAFGPYQRHGLLERYDPMPREDRIIVAAGVIGFAVLAILFLTGVIA